MKYFFFLLLIPLTCFAQYLEVELSDRDLDPLPIVKDMGGAPKEAGSRSVQDNNRSPAKEGITRAPAVLDTDNSAPASSNR
jgi:hypothetical protein